MLRELTTDDGAFAASQDADTDGVEGATFTWRADEVRAALGDDAAVFSTAYGVTDAGNWEGVSILSRVRSAEELAKLYAIPAGSVEERLARARARLLAVRAARPQPARDDKALAAWNGLAIGALADAARLLGHVPDGDGATRHATGPLRSGQRRRSSTGSSAKTAGWAARGRMAAPRGRACSRTTRTSPTDCSRCTRRRSTSAGSRRLARSRDAILERFVDPDGGFFDTATDHERLVTRPKDTQDNATPSGGAMATHVLLRLAALTGEGRYRDAAERAIAAITPFAARYPTAFAQWLQAHRLRPRARGRGRDRRRSR